MEAVTNTNQPETGKGAIESPDSSGNPLMSVIIPAYNAAPFIEDTLKQLQGSLDEGHEKWGEPEIIVVDDCSTDNMADVIRSQYPSVRLIRHDVNKGKGGAVRTGMLAARGQYRFFCDADLPYDLICLDMMWRYLTFKEFDICIGSRDLRESSFSINYGFVRTLASNVFTTLINRIVVTGINDTQCGIKGFRGPIADYLFRHSFIDGFAFDVEILYLAHKNNLDIKRVPVNLQNNEASTVSVWKHAPQMLISVLGLPVRYYSGKYPMIHDLEPKNAEGTS